MNPIPSAEQQQDLEQFRQLLFHLQMQSGSIHNIFHFFKEQESMQYFQALKAIDPNLMTQLLAREYVLEARKSPCADDARSHLQTALRLDPRCPEAFFEMANISNTPEAAMKWYSKCMEYSVKQLGSERFDQLLEDFKEKPWRQIELYTYLKAKPGLAEKLFREGLYDVAVLPFRELLEWNPADDIHIRHFLFVALLCENRLSEAQSLQRDYPADLSAQWYYCRAFLRYKMEGNSRRANRLLLRAFKRNLWAALYMLGLREMPPAQTRQNASPAGSAAFKEGSKMEAVECVRYTAAAVIEDARMAAWLWDRLRRSYEGIV